jgi:hypothetical protein
MDATIEVNGQNWVKPGAEGGTTWKGYEYDGQWVDPIPSPDQIKAAFEMIQLTILAPVLEELITVSQQKITTARQNG